jgi:hypothetical protein
LCVGGLLMYDQALFDRIVTCCKEVVGPLDTPCLLWQRGLNHKGYGLCSVKGTTRRVHRVMYEAVHGPFNRELMCLHSCDNPACCNILHLRLGTASDNMQDASKRGRLPPKDGEHGHGAKLTTSQVKEINALYKSGQYKQKQLAEKYGVRPQSISNIVCLKTWVAALTQPEAH